MTEPHASDRELVRRLLAGDEEAFNEFFQGHFPRLFRFAMTRLEGRADVAEEIAQATLCRAMEKLGTYRGEAALFTWLCTICRHEIGTHFERTGRRASDMGLHEDSDEIRAALDSLAAGSWEPQESRIHREQVARLVHVALDNLPWSYASVLEWKYLQDLPVKEIASRLRLSAKAAESLLTRARVAFREAFSVLNGTVPDLDTPHGAEAERTSR